jgi:NADH:ubiquinone oxidoreductase subunit K
VFFIIDGVRTGDRIYTTQNNYLQNSRTQEMNTLLIIVIFVRTIRAACGITIVILFYNWTGNTRSTHITNLLSKFLTEVLLKTHNDNSLTSIDAMLDNPQNDINSQRNLSSRTSAFLELVLNQINIKYAISEQREQNVNQILARFCTSCKWLRTNLIHK